MKYKILSHTADLRLEVYGATLEELFINAAEVLAQIMRTSDVQNIESVNLGTSEVQRIELRSPNITALLVDFLNEILARSHINKGVYRVKIIKFNLGTSDVQKIESANLGASEVQDIGLSAEIIGMSVKKFDEDVKAVTYHEAEIKQIAKSPDDSAIEDPRQSRDKEQVVWQTRLVLDI